MTGLEAIHVVAGVITDGQGRVLLAQRHAGTDMAGLWEFPGGKVDPGESPQAALARELREELGIDVEVGAALIAVPQAMPHKRIVLDVYRIDAFTGEPLGVDGQALAWVTPEALARHAMPPADRPVVAALQQPDRYLVTPAPEGGSAEWLAALDTALAAGIRRVQLRAPGYPAMRWRGLAAAAALRCRQAGAQALLNGDAAMALELGIGLHLRAAQLATPDRPLLEALRASGQPLAASCHGIAELRQAQALGCDFAVLGPVNATASHPGQSGIGWEAFAAIREHASLPVYAIGGLGPGDIGLARAHGAQGIAAIRALWPPS